ncbi:tRNA preQ1(34) S-adenosylmethionine ribosyltransferase-isomerase QueA [Virgibacillus sp. W0430]|uniref:tRNA preQ1(34) S-adenosylmethionine ribosyltransferase-isomerase QueA n=1 Tax=Virgibacillus sp. W0430 TaxID=3391580 RepID=UPI003F44A06B
MNVEDFDFNLPEQLIAQTPLKDRTSSRLLVLNKQADTINHTVFSEIVHYLKEGDCLVLNDTRVLPARIYGIKKDSGAKIEILLLHQIEGERWETLVKPAKRVKIGTEIIVGNGKLRMICVEKKAHGGCVFDFYYDGIFYELLEELGEMPLPPYIKEQLPEKERYQTVYAKETGSAAAPTAGLHFTEELLEEIKKKGVLIQYITLHVGLGTFRPVSAESIENHEMHAEFYHMSEETAETLMNIKKQGGKIIAVGTTTTRTLETIARDHNGELKHSSGWTNIFIYPPYTFRAIDGLITNFHLPKSTLIMLVSAFAGKDRVLKAYNEAICKQYRFFSFGDAMLILK